MANEVKLYPVIGESVGPGGRKVRVKWKDVEILHLNGRQIATIPTRPGAPIGLLGGIQLTPAEEKAVEEAVARARGGVKPQWIKPQVEMPYELLDDDEGDDTEVDELGDE